MILSVILALVILNINVSSIATEGLSLVLFMPKLIFYLRNKKKFKRMQ
jgi:hypothetical protein